MSKTLPVGGLSCDRMNKAIAYIEVNMSEPIRLQDIAGAAAFSPFHFSRAFKKATGFTPMRYVLICRVNAAKKMLADPSMQQAEITYQCGFGSDSHFCTAFKSITGMTTTAWRKLKTRSTAMALAVFAVLDVGMLVSA